MITRLNISQFRHFNDPEFTVLYFVRPWGSRLFRVFSIPLSIVNREELIQVLNTLCVRLKHGVWYFKSEDFEDISMTLTHMDIEHYFGEQDEDKMAAYN